MADHEVVRETIHDHTEEDEQWETEEEEDNREATELHDVSASQALRDALEQDEHSDSHSVSTRSISSSSSSPIAKLSRLWRRNISITVPHDKSRDHLANERTYLAYLRTSLTLAMLSIVIEQLFRLQHSLDPNMKYGFYVLGKPLAGICQGAAMLILIFGAHRFFRQQSAMVRGKAIAGGWEILAIVAIFFTVSVLLFAVVLGVEIFKDEGNT